MLNTILSLVSFLAAIGAAVAGYLAFGAINSF